jgi:Rad3-related DNA helicase
MSLTTEEKESQPTKLLASLANEANLKIKINKQLSDIIIIYKNQINEIKKIINKNREENFSAPKKDKENIQLILEYISKIKLLKNKIKEEIAKSTKKNK